jgi:CBS domain-containing membrane protein
MEQKRVRDLMTVEVATVGRNDSLSIADRIMTLGRVRHMPVVDEHGKLCGMVSQRDLMFNALARALGYGSFAKEKTLDSLRVESVMTTDVHTIGPDAPLAKAATIMLDKKIGCLPVLDGDQLVGILTEADFVKAYR